MENQVEKVLKNYSYPIWNIEVIDQVEVEEHSDNDFVCFFVGKVRVVKLVAEHKNRQFKTHKKVYNRISNFFLLTVDGNKSFLSNVLLKASHIYVN